MAPRAGQGSRAHRPRRHTAHAHPPRRLQPPRHARQAPWLLQPAGHNRPPAHRPPPRHTRRPPHQPPPRHTRRPPHRPPARCAPAAHRVRPSLPRPAWQPRRPVPQVPWQARPPGRCPTAARCRLHSRQPPAAHPVSQMTTIRPGTKLPATGWPTATRSNATSTVRHAATSWAGSARRPPCTSSRAIRASTGRSTVASCTS